jgi:hypothetical protein
MVEVHQLARFMTDTVAENQPRKPSLPARATLYDWRDEMQDALSQSIDLRATIAQAPEE